MWEDGKRIKWFTPEQVQKINEQIIDYSEFFEMTKSKTEVPKGLKLDTPSNIKELVDELIKEFPEFK